MERISVIVTCYNEIENIRACLETLTWADELLVVDSFSTDGTVEIARAFTDNVLQREFDGFASQRNWALSKAKHPWILMVDADERVTPELQEEIRTILCSEREYSGYSILRRNFFAGKEIRYCGWQRDWVLRLFRKDAAYYEATHLHESVKLAGKAGQCQNKLIHYPYRDVKAYLEKLRRYADLGGLDAAKQGKRATFGRLLFHPIGRFLRMYLMQGGFRDGKHGLIICLLAASYVSLQDVRLWELEILNQKLCE